MNSAAKSVQPTPRAVQYQKISSKPGAYHTLNAPSPSAPSRVESTVLKKTNPTAVAGLAVYHKRKRHATHFTSGKWLPNLPLPPAY